MSSTIRLTVPFYKQTTDYSCGQASVQMLLHYFKRVSPSEEELIRRMRPNRSETEDTYPDELIRVLKEEGLQVYTKNESSLEEVEGFLKKELPVLVYFIEPSENVGHYAIIIGLSDTHVYLNDPWNGEGFSLTREDFSTRWHNEKNTFQRWLLVASHKQL